MVSRRSRDVLPAPLGPSTTQKSPAFTSNFTSSSATCAP